MKKKSTLSGFSYVELMLSMILVGLCAVSVTLGYDMSSPSAELARRKIAADIRLAQSLAMSTKLKHGFRTLSTTSYEIYQTSPGNPIKDPSKWCSNWFLPKNK